MATATAQHDATPAGDAALRVWLLLGPKHGDNAQLEAVAAALAERLPCDLRRLHLAFHRCELLVNLLLGVSPAGLSARARRSLPSDDAPDLLLTAGRRNEPVARWLQRAGGMHAALVHCGRPWADPRRFDLVLSTTQYELDDRRWPNVVVLPLPPAAPRPVGSTPPAADAPLLLVVGGDSGSKQLPPGVALAIFERSLALASALARPLRVITSPRTRRESEAALLDAASAAGADAHGWHADRSTNPYEEWLAEAGAYVVTEDSVSMVADAADHGRPLWFAALERDPRPWWATKAGWGWAAATHELAQRFAPRRFRRDTRRLLDALVRSGRARWLAEDAIRAFEPTGSDRASSARTAADEIVTRVLKRETARR